MTTARLMIEDALREIHVLGVGQPLENDEAQAALRTLQRMFDSWSLTDALIFTEVRESFDLVVGTTEYTIGPGATFNTTRPISLKAAFVRWDEFDYTLQLQDTISYSKGFDKDLQGIPSYIYYDYNFPTGTIILWQAPNQDMDLHLYSVKPLTNFVDLTTSITVGLGYELGIVQNLAVQLAPSYEREPTPTLQKLAALSLGQIKKANTRNETFKTSVDDALLQSFNISNILTLQQ